MQVALTAAGMAISDVHMVDTLFDIDIIIAHMLQQSS